MNFLSLGSAFLLFQLNLSWASNYVVKAVGFLFILVGLGELGSLCKLQEKNVTAKEYYGKEGIRFVGHRNEVINKIKNQNKLMLLCCLVAVVSMFLLKLLEPSALALNVISIILGVCVTAMSLQLFRSVVMFITDNEKFCNAEGAFVSDESNVTRLNGTFYKYSAVTLLNLGCDILSRIIPVHSVQVGTSLVVAISKIVMYVLLAILVYEFWKIRNDSNKKNESEYTEQNLP